MVIRPTGAITTPDAEVAGMFGGTAAQIPTDAPLPQLEIMRESQQFKSTSGTLLKEVAGHILHWHECNVYWSRPFGETDGSRPDCASSDGIAPDGGESPLAGPCRDCPNNQYDSAPDGGRGKACQNSIRIYFLPDGYRLPMIIKASPASLGKKESLIPWLTNSLNEGLGGKFQTIHVRLDLYEKRFEKYTASILRVSSLGVLDAQRDADLLQRLGAMYQQVTQYHQARAAVDVESTDRHTGEAGQPGDHVPI
jgi:hypothetical protein